MKNVLVAYRRLFVVLVHVALWTASTVGAFLLRFDFDVPAAFWARVPAWLVLMLGLRIAFHWYFGLFHGLWRYSSTRDLANLLKASALASGVFAALALFAWSRGIPRSVIVIDLLASIMAVGGLRFGIRTVRELGLRQATDEAAKRRVLVVGAGDAGEMLMREITRVHQNRYVPVGFLDDDRFKHGSLIHGVPVLGPIADVGTIARTRGAQEIVVAIPSLTGRELRRIVDECSSTGASIRTLPGVDRLIDGKVTLNQLEHVRIEDLLGREPVALDTAAISEAIAGRVVLVTGAGGSIGSELCRQILRFGPRRLVLVEQAENALYHVHRSLLAQATDGIDVVPVIADICDSRRLEGVFDAERPELVFHAAAHKHVPMMEWNPGEAVKNNVFGTKKVADLADRFGAEKFVMVSTDKAVNPTSVMGVSKRTAEIYVQSLSQRSKTQFVTVRFGNVLGSAGSVIPLFQEQIARGGPVTVTHPEMRRYFMTIPEACQLVMQAGTMGEGGEIFVLDMGEPVKIVDLANDLIRLSGLEPGADVEIVFTGLRPGEKLFEELAAEGEGTGPTRHPKISVGKFRPYALEDVSMALDRLHALSDGAAPATLKAAFRVLVPEYVERAAPQTEPPQRESAVAAATRPSSVPSSTPRNGGIVALPS